MTTTVKTYPKYKDSGVEWANNVPCNWNVKPLRYCCLENTQKNKTLSIMDILSLSYGNVILKNIDKNFGLVPESYSSYQILEPGDVVMRLTDLQNDHVSLRTGLVKNKGIITSAYLGLKIRHDKLDYRFFHWLLHSYDLQKVYYGMGGGIRQTVGYDDLKWLPILMPDIETQKNIADFLDEKTAKIDLLIAGQERLMVLRKEEVISLVSSSINSTKTNEMRLGNAAKIVSRPVIQKENKAYTAIGLFNRGRGLFHKDSHEIDDMGESDFFWVEEGDLILSGQFAWEGAVALAGKEETGCVVSHRYPVLRGKSGIVLTEYLLGLFLTKHGDFLLNENSRGAAGRNRPLNIDHLMKEKIPIPDMHVQKRIAQAIHRNNQLRSIIIKQIENLKEYRTSLIHSAVTGKIKI